MTNKAILNNLITCFRRTLQSHRDELYTQGSERQILNHVCDLFDSAYPGNVSLSAKVANNLIGRFDTILAVSYSCSPITYAILGLRSYLSCWICNADKDTQLWKDAEERWNTYLDRYNARKKAQIEGE